MTYKIPKNATIKSILNNTCTYEDVYDNDSMVGLCITTDKGDIKILIDDYQRCCEDFGALFLETPDNLDKFIGAKILKIEDVCTASACEDKSEECAENQLKITTNKGVLQYAVYNSHNGYYSHATFVQVFDSIERDFI